MTMNVIPPFSEKDKQVITDFASSALRDGKIDRAYSNFSHNEAIAVILPATSFNISEAEFILAMARGELPDQEIDENGNVIEIVY